MTDLINEWRQPTPYRWQILGISVAATFAMMMVFLPEDQRAPPEKPTITWINTFDPGRTDAQIVESNIENQQRQDAIHAAEKARDERRREFYRAVGRASGLDVDELEKEFSDDQAPTPAPSPSLSSAPARTTGE